MEMISRRLTKAQKAEILHAYMAGDNTNFLAEKYSCTANTINRTVKTLLTDSQYKLLKEKRSRISNEKVKIVKDLILKEEKEDLCIELDEELNNPEVNIISNLEIEDTDNFCEELSSKNKINKNQEFDINNSNDFELIEPLLSEFDFDQDKQKSHFEILHYENLPESVYMIVDKKVELDLQLISDLPEWSFLPADELERNAILLFSNQRSAKRNCSRNQRVIKIPNTSIFKISKSYLISKGITRLILDDSIIALDD
tara:strand:- start:343 stop:1110 length:768 start_codon:yes stop_codon:yes gene_type:complete